MRLRLPADVFWRLTPRQLRVLADKDRERIDEEREHGELCAAIVAHTVAIYAGKTLKEGKETELIYGNFMPSFQPQIHAARTKHASEALRGFLSGLAIDKGLK